MSRWERPAHGAAAVAASLALICHVHMNWLHTYIYIHILGTEKSRQSKKLLLQNGTVPERNSSSISSNISFR